MAKSLKRFRNDPGARNSYFFNWKYECGELLRLFGNENFVLLSGTGDVIHRSNKIANVYECVYNLRA